MDSCAGLGASQWFVGGAQCRPSGKRPWIWVFQWVGRRFRRVGGRLGRLDVEGGSARNQPRWAGRIRGSVAEIGEIRTEIRPKSGVRPRARSVDSADYRRRLDRADDWPDSGGCRTACLGRHTGFSDTGVQGAADGTRAVAVQLVRRGRRRRAKEVQ